MGQGLFKRWLLGQSNFSIKRGLMNYFIGCLLPIRVAITLLGFCALVCAYTNRVSISHVITMLVVPHNRTEEHTSTEQVCPKEDSDPAPSSSNVSYSYVFSTISISIHIPIPITIVWQNLGEYKWSEQLQGFVLGSFYIGYLLTHLPGGVLADLYGAKWVLGFCVFISGLTTLFSPIAIKFGEAIGLIIIRIIMGAAQGPLFPALTTLLSAWVPKRERATLGTLCYSGVTAGTVVSNLGSGFMLHEFHWSITLIVFGVITSIWFACFVSLFTLFKKKLSQYQSESCRLYSPPVVPVTIRVSNQKNLPISKKILHKVM